MPPFSCMQALTNVVLALCISSTVIMVIACKLVLLPAICSYLLVSSSALTHIPSFVSFLHLRCSPLKPQWYVAAANCSGDLISNEFVSNYARSGGGVWQTTTGNYVVFNNLFTGNNATLGSGGYQMTNCTSCEFSLNQFTFNRGQQGAGLYLGQSNGTIDSCYFDNNTANAYGGALFLDTDSANVTSCTFDSNYAYLIGGGIYGQRGTGDIESSLFSSNSARYANGVYWNAWDGLINTNNVLDAADILFDASTGNSQGIQGTDTFSRGNQGSSSSTTNADGVVTDTPTGATSSGSDAAISDDTTSASGENVDGIVTDTPTGATSSDSSTAPTAGTASSSSDTAPMGSGINT